MDEFIAAFMIAVVGGATVAALLSVFVILLPGLSGSTARVIETMPGRSFALGAVNFIFFFAVGLVLSRIGDGIGGFFGGLFTLVALIIFIVLLLLLSIGLGSLVRLISERGKAQSPVSMSQSPQPMGQLFRAAALLVAGGLAPLAGWFVLTPLAMFIGLGATIISLVQWLGGRFSKPAAPPTPEKPV
jgi:hypothetical protein